MLLVLVLWLVLGILPGSFSVFRPSSSSPSRTALGVSVLAPRGARVAAVAAAVAAAGRERGRALFSTGQRRTAVVAGGGRVRVLLLLVSLLFLLLPLPRSLRLYASGGRSDGGGGGRGARGSRGTGVVVRRRARARPFFLHRVPSRLRAGGATTAQHSAAQRGAAASETASRRIRSGRNEQEERPWFSAELSRIARYVGCVFIARRGGGPAEGVHRVAGAVLVLGRLLPSAAAKQSCEREHQSFRIGKAAFARVVWFPLDDQLEQGTADQPGRVPMLLV